MSNALPAAAWFPDPHDPAQLRWWDGAAWTEHVHAQVAPVPVPQVTEVPQLVQVAQAAAHEPVPEPEERILEEYYGDDPEPGLFGLRNRLSFRVQLGSGRSMHGKATISAVDTEGDGAFDEATARARLADSDLSPEQIESAVKVQAKVAALMAKAAGHPIACRAAHAVLRKLAYSTARGGPHDAMDIVFDGRRYRAYGGRLNG